MQKNPFNEQVLKTYFVYLLSCILFSVYCFHVANNFRECTISIFMTSAAFVVTVNYTILVLQSMKMFKLIESLEKTIEERT